MACTGAVLQLIYRVEGVRVLPFFMFIPFEVTGMASSTAWLISAVCPANVLTVSSVTPETGETLSVAWIVGRAVTEIEWCPVTCRMAILTR